VDCELAQRFTSGSLRRLQLCTGAGDTALMHADDYACLLDAEADTEEHHAFSAFRDCVLPACTSVTVTATSLLSLLASSQPEASLRLGLLLRSGFLARADIHRGTGQQAAGAAAAQRQTADGERFVFSAPGLGLLQRQLVKGREAVRALLRRRQQRQAFREDVEKRRLSGCLLPASFVVLDMLGCGVLVQILVPRGAVLRLVA
jgi:hypothetical protein